MAISVCTSTKQQNCMRALVAMRHLVYKNREDLSVGHRDQGSRQKKEVKSAAISRCGFMDHANKNKTQKFAHAPPQRTVNRRAVTVEVTATGSCRHCRDHHLV
jgi:hypothetical protein